VSEPGRDWDAATYDRVSAPQLRWAREQLGRVRLRGDEVVLDAGCGSGRATALLCELVPRGRVYAVDAAPSMVAHAQRALRGRATVLRQDLTKLALPEPVELAFSNATFHWIADHDALFTALARNMRPGARLLAQCGGLGNIERFRRAAGEVAGEPAFAGHFAGWRQPWRYAGAEETERRLRRAGFAQVSCWLERRPTAPPEPREFARAVCLAPQLEALPEELREPFLERVLERWHERAGEPPALDYVRLNMTAVRA
jgi:trans-aconitate 2-methyltransferase